MRICAVQTRADHQQDFLNITAVLMETFIEAFTESFRKTFIASFMETFMKNFTETCPLLRQRPLTS